MIRTSICAGIALTAFTLMGTAAMAQSTETPTSPAAETAPQTSASTTVKSPAGVSTNAVQSDTTGSTGAKLGCKTASAEMTNGAVETCKQ